MVWREIGKDLNFSKQENNNSGQWAGSLWGKEEGFKRKRETCKRQWVPPRARIGKGFLPDS